MSPSNVTSEKATSPKASVTSTRLKAFASPKNLLQKSIGWIGLAFGEDRRLIEAKPVANKVSIAILNER
jgi:hypothetical protein